MSVEPADVVTRLPGGVAAIGAGPHTPSRPTSALLRFTRGRPLGALGLAILALLSALGLFAGVLATHDPSEVRIALALERPSTALPFGTDHLGRDIWSRLVYGARYSMAVALAATAAGTLIGGAAGLAGGYRGGLLDLAVQRVLDVMMALPTLILALAVVTALGPSLLNIIAAVAFPMIPRTARVLRASTLQLKQLAYVDAARLLGANEGRIMLRHILPNAAAPLIVLATAQVGMAILTEAALGFLGLGVPPPAPTWGGMLARDAARFFELAPWTAIYPGVAITLAVFAANLFGDTLRDMLDPRLRGTGRG
jgi:peptide/nickel transport system permease protein